jgi:hypothetical protein
VRSRVDSSVNDLLDKLLDECIAGAILVARAIIALALCGAFVAWLLGWHWC